MKFSSTANFGYGRSMNYAVKNIVDDGYGDSSHETRRSHRARLRLLVAFLKAIGVKDIRSIEREHLLTYGEYLSELRDDGAISIHTAQNRLSSANVLMSLVTEGTFSPISPSSLVGRRNYVRTTEPNGLYHDQFRPALESLLESGETSLALLVAFCRYLGLRFREGSLIILKDAKRQISKSGKVTILRGSKGGRAKKVKREIRAPRPLIDLLNAEGERIQSLCLVHESMTYVQWYGWAHKRFSKLAPVHGLGSKFHELRASYACERLERVTGSPAPCASRPGASQENRPAAEQLTDKEARQLIAVEMGHNRSDVLTSYCGGSSR